MDDSPPAKKQKTEPPQITTPHTSRDAANKISDVQVIPELNSEPGKDFGDHIPQSTPKFHNLPENDSTNISIPILYDNANHTETSDCNTEVSLSTEDSDQQSVQMQDVNIPAEDSDQQSVQMQDVNIPAEDSDHTPDSDLSVHSESEPTPGSSQDVNDPASDSKTHVTFSTISLQSEADQLIKKLFKESFPVKVHYKGPDLYVYCSPCDTDLKMGKGRTRLLNFKTHLKNDIHKAIDTGIKGLLESNKFLELKEGLNKSIYCRACSSEIKGKDPATLISNVDQHLKGKTHGLKVKNLPPPITSMFKKVPAPTE